MYQCIVNGFVAKLNHWFDLNGIIVVSDTYRWFISLFEQSQQDKKQGHDNYAFRHSAFALYIVTDNINPTSNLKSDLGKGDSFGHPRCLGLI